MPPAYTYFDTNRDAGAILSIRKLTIDTNPNFSVVVTNGSTTAGDGAGTNYTADWKTVAVLGTWRGTVAGCDADDKITAGTCSANSILTGTDINATAAAGLNRWRSSTTEKFVFSVLRTKGTRF